MQTEGKNKTMVAVLGFSAFVGIIALMLASSYVGSYPGPYGFSVSTVSEADVAKAEAELQELRELITDEEEQRPTKGDGFYVLVQAKDTSEFAHLSNMTEWSGIVRGSDFVPHDVKGTADEFIPLICEPEGTGYIVTMQ
jgi:hypothetical protein